MHIDDSYKSCRFSTKTKHMKQSSLLFLVSKFVKVSIHIPMMGNTNEMRTNLSFSAVTVQFPFHDFQCVRTISRYPVCPVVNNACPWHVFGRVPKENDLHRH